MAKRRRLNRELVIEAAAVMADQAGTVSAVRLSALAQTLQIQPPSLYNHIDNLADLRFGLAVYALRQLLSQLRQASQGLVGREALLASAMAYRRFAHDHPGLYPLTIRAPEPDEDMLIGLSQELLQMLLLLMASLGLQGDDALHAIRGLRAVLHGFVSLEAAGGFKMALDREESFQRLVESYLAFLQGKSAT
jgi:AcrR family transcriptional regulator